MSLSVTTTQQGRHTVLTAAGDVDLHSAGHLREVFAGCVDAGSRHLVVDLERVGFLDSTGLGTLVGALRRVRDEGGSLLLAAPNERIVTLLRITGLEKVFPVVATTRDALTATGA